MNNDNNVPKIEKGIPIPEHYYVKGTSAVLKEMQVGDSILLEDGSITVRNRWYQAALREGVRVTIRKQEGGSRLWRIK